MLEWSRQEDCYTEPYWLAGVLPFCIQLYASQLELAFQSARFEVYFRDQMTAHLIRLAFTNNA